jgi:hypothetical protein
MKYETPKNGKSLLKNVQKARNPLKFRTRFVAKTPNLCTKTKNEPESGARIEELFLKKYQNPKK